jgi:hypothetical protein
MGQSAQVSDGDREPSSGMTHHVSAVCERNFQLAILIKVFSYDDVVYNANQYGTA